MMDTNIPLTFTDLSELINPTYLQRGIRYANAGRVLGLQVEQEGRLLYSSVAGSGHHIYKCSISLEPDVGDVVVIMGYCSCPVGFNCKHVAASLYQQISHQKEASTMVNQVSSGVGTWLRDIKRIAESTQKLSASKDELHFLLNIREDSYRRTLTVDTVKTRRLKSGDWGKAARFTTGSRTTASFVTARDMELLIMLEGAEQRGFGGAGNYNLPAKGTGGVVQRLVESGRCHWQSLQQQPLQAGDVIEGKLDWQENEAGTVSLRIVDPREKHLLLPCLPPRYINVAEHILGRFVSGLDEQVEYVLVTAPTISGDDCEAVIDVLEQAFPALEMPVPKVKRAPLRSDIPPIPYLKLASEDRWHSTYSNDQYQNEAFGILTFSYGGHEVASQNQGQHLSWKNPDGQIIRVQRHLQQEADYLRQLGAVEVFPNDLEQSQEGVRMHHSQGESGWIQFVIDVLPQLQKQDWVIEIDPSWHLHVIEPDAWYADVQQDGASDWFDLELGVRLDGKELSLLPMLVDFIASSRGAGQLDDLLAREDQAPLIVSHVRDGKQQYLKLPFGKVKHIIQTLVDLYHPKSLDADGKLRMSRYQAIQLNQLAEADLEWGGAAGPRKFAEKLAKFDGINTLTPPRTLKAELRQYQQQGFEWLQFLRKYELGGILADDMGLGKTVQTLAHLLKEKAARRAKTPSLVVATTSLMVNWANEAAHFAPSLKVLTLQGSDRKQKFDQIGNYDLVLTTYPLLSRDSEVLLAQDWHLLILDESQHIKNARSRVTQTACQLKARHRLCLTGTPMENHLGELWSQFNFLMPGLLGTEQHFRKLFRTPIEKQGDQQRQQQLNQRIKPFMLRREKAQVLEELPEKTEIVSLVELDGKQRQLYETIRVAMDKRIRQEIDKKGIARSQIIILDALLKLRQVCCDPRLLKTNAAKGITHSAKLVQLKEMLPELLEEGRRILLFSQFTSMLALIEPELDKLKIPYVKLTGQTRDRATPIEDFQAGKVPLFLISLKAGGTGLNLTAADTVIHYDPWWNPAVERQATDRAHRIGQQNKVFVYKLMARGTVEEKINELQQKKQALADALFDGSKTSVSLNKEDLSALFEPLG